MTLLSRILGFVRDIVVARFFGAGMGTDAFFVAFKIPNFLRRLFAEGAFSQGFVPVLSEFKAQRSEAEVRQLAAHVAGTLGGILALVTLVGVLAAPWLIMLFAPGFLDEPDKLALAAEMLRYTFPYLFFISLTAFAGGILNTFGRFAVPAFTPVLLNLCLIGAAIFLAPYFSQPVFALAIGVFVAGAAQLLFQLPFLWRLGMLPLPRWGWRDSGVQRILRLMLPAIFGSSVMQINLLLDTLLASFLVTGSVSWLYYSDRLVEFPVGILGVALATVILPKLSRDHATASGEAFTRTLDWALRLVLIFSIPAALGLFLLAGPLLATLFQYGAFQGDDVRLSSYSLMAYSWGLIGFILVKVLAPGFYARQDTKTPVRIGIIAMVSNMVLNIVFVLAILWSGREGAHAGLALATACSAFINSGLLYRALRRQGIYRPQPGWWPLGLQVAGATLAMAAFLMWWVAPLSQWLDWNAGTRALQLAQSVALGALVYLACLWALGLRRGHLIRRG